MPAANQPQPYNSSKPPLYDSHFNQSVQQHFDIKKSTSPVLKKIKKGGK